MNIKLTTGIIVFLFVLAACGTQETSTQQVSEQEAAPEPEQQVTTAPQPAQETAPTALTDLKSVFAMTGEFKCTYKVDAVSQVSYVKNGKVRSDATVQGMEAHTVYHGDDLWTWSSQGCFHMKLSEIEKLSSKAPVPKTESTDEIASKAADVKCEPASIPESMFNAPSPCQDMTEMMKQLQSQMPTG